MVIALLVLLGLLFLSWQIRFLAHLLGRDLRRERGMSVVLSKLQSGVIAPAEPYPARWFLAREVLALHYYEVRRLTIPSFLWWLLVSEVAWTWWSLLFSLWRLGVLDLESGMRYPATVREWCRAWSWKPWRSPRSVWKRPASRHPERDDGTAV